MFLTRAVLKSRPHCIGSQWLKGGTFNFSSCHISAEAVFALLQILGMLWTSHGPTGKKYALLRIQVVQWNSLPLRPSSGVHDTLQKKQATQAWLKLEEKTGPGFSPGKQHWWCLELPLHMALVEERLPQENMGFPWEQDCHLVNIFKHWVYGLKGVQDKSSSQVVEKVEVR